MLKAIVFDIDGTLIDTEQNAMTALKESLQEVEGLTYTIEELRFVFGIPSEKSLEYFPVTHPEKVREKWVKKEAEYSKEAKLFSNMEEVVAQIADSTCKTGIVTSKSRQEYNNYFVDLKISAYFDEVVVADDTSQHKPNPEPLLYCLKKLGISPSEAIYIGDTIYDNQCATAAGVKFGLAYWGAHSMEGFNADYVFENPSELLALIKE
ncbi:MAG: HAD family hydrolase [Bacillus sp. (in: firmicutes)]